MGLFDDSEAAALKIFLAAGHTPKLDKNGKPDPMGFDIDDYESGGGHNGYACTKCYCCLCVWCSEGTGFKVEECGTDPR